MLEFELGTPERDLKQIVIPVSRKGLQVGTLCLDLIPYLEMQPATTLVVQ